MAITSTPLRYPGGKSQLAPFVIELLRANDLFYGEYIEPFAGGAGIACKLLLSGYVSRIRINDLDPAIHGFWWAVLNEPDRLCRRIESTPVTVEEWRKQRAVQKVRDPDPVDLGFSTFFLNRTNRSGIIDGGVIGGLDQDGEYSVDCRFNKLDLVKKIQRIALYHEQITLTSEDGRKFLQRLNRMNLSRVLINIDPPYFLKGRELYQNWYEADDHEALATAVSKLRHLWMVTYDDTPETRKLYAAHRRYNQQLTYSAQIKRAGVELLVLDRRLKMPAAYRPARTA